MKQFKDLTLLELSEICNKYENCDCGCEYVEDCHNTINPNSYNSNCPSDWEFKTKTEE